MAANDFRKLTARLHCVSCQADVVFQWDQSRKGWRCLNCQAYDYQEPPGPGCFPWICGLLSVIWFFLLFHQ